jgi:hypothetical protein
LGRKESFGAVVNDKTLRRTFDTMRIKKLKRSPERKAKIAPAEWQQFIEI